MGRVVDQPAIHGPIEGGRGVASEINIKNWTHHQGHSVLPIKQREISLISLYTPVYGACHFIKIDKTSWT